MLAQQDLAHVLGAAHADDGLAQQVRLEDCSVFLPPGAVEARPLNGKARERCETISKARVPLSLWRRPFPYHFVRIRNKVPQRQNLIQPGQRSNLSEQRMEIPHHEGDQGSFADRNFQCRDSTLARIAEKSASELYKSAPPHILHTNF